MMSPDPPAPSAGLASEQGYLVEIITMRRRSTQTCVSGSSKPFSRIEAIVIIVQRLLAYTVPGKEAEVRISIYAPLRGKHDWNCAYEIAWPDTPRHGSGYGVDGMQSLLLALQAIGTEIYTSDYHRSGCLYWKQPGQGYGFPVPSTIRDLLIGDDARLYR